MSNVSAVTDASFQSDVLESPVPVLVDFWADWCGPCRQVAPIVDQVATELGGKLRVLKLDVDTNPLTAARYGVRSIPTLIFFAGGQARGQLVGLRAKGEILSEIERVVGVRA